MITREELDEKRDALVGNAIITVMQHGASRAFAAEIGKICAACWDACHKELESRKPHHIGKTYDLTQENFNRVLRELEDRMEEVRRLREALDYISNGEAHDGCGPEPCCCSEDYARKVLKQPHENGKVTREER